MIDGPNEALAALLFPLDGDMLNEYDGFTRDEHLHIKVRPAGPEGSRFTVNGIIAERTEGAYFAEIKVSRLPEYNHDCGDWNRL